MKSFTYGITRAAVVLIVFLAACGAAHNCVSPPVAPTPDAEWDPEVFIPETTCAVWYQVARDNTTRGAGPRYLVIKKTNNLYLTQAISAHDDFQDAFCECLWLNRAHPDCIDKVTP